MKLNPVISPENPFVNSIGVNFEASPEVSSVVLPRILSGTFSEILPGVFHELIQEHFSGII